MAPAPELKKKTEMDQLAETINRWIQMADDSRKGLTPDNLKNYERIGQQARQKQISEATPTKTISTMVARKRDETQVRPERTVNVGHREMEASIDLATSIELAAARGKKFDPEQWVKGKG